MDSSNCGEWDQLLRGMWNLPGPGIEPVSSYTSRQILNNQGRPESGKELGGDTRNPNVSSSPE